MSPTGSPCRYADLFDIENRPGAGVRLWGRTVEQQLARVIEASDRQRLGNAPDRPEGTKDADADRALHSDTYFLALAVRRVLRFADAIAEQISDERLDRARDEFVAVAPQLKDMRDIYEHLDEYLLGEGQAQRHGRIADRIAPILELRWDCANVVVRFGSQSLDLTLAAQAAIRLADATAAIWEEHLDATREDKDPPPDDGIARML